MSRLYKYAAVIMSGALTGCVVSYFIPAAVQWFSMIPFMFVLYMSVFAARDGATVKKNLRKSLLLGFLYFYTYYIFVFHWFILMYPLEFTELSRGSALAALLVAWLGLSLLQTIFAMWQIPLFFAVMRSRWLCRDGMPRLSAPFMYALIYIVFEWLQTQTWAGVPWGRLAIGQCNYTVGIQTASLFGSYFISFVIVAVNGCIALGLYRAYMIKKNIIPCDAKKTRGYNYIGVTALAAVAVFSVNTVSGVIILAARAADTDVSRVGFAAVQGNVSSTDKWRDDSFEGLSAVYEELTMSAADEGVDAVLWPETAIPYSINRHLYMCAFLEKLSHDADVTLLATAFWRDNADPQAVQSGEAEDGKPYNCVFTVTPDGGIDTDNFYAKRRLVPFGEFVPYEAVIKFLIPPLSQLGMYDNNLIAGTSASIHNISAGRVGSLICFDSIYEALALDAVHDGAEIITISTNDSWLGQSAALYQHAAQAKLRAVECDRYIVRAGNTGLTCVISPSGRIIDELEPDTRGYLTCDVYKRDTKTLYSITGNIIIIFAAAAYCAAITDIIIKAYKDKRLAKREQNR